MVKGLLERLMLEERELLLKTHPTKGNGYYTRDLFTLHGPVEDLRVPRVREGEFRPAILPERRRASLKLSEAIPCMYASGLSTRDIAKSLETVYGTLYSPQSIPRLTQVEEEEEEKALWSLRERWGLTYPKIVGRWEGRAYACWPSCAIQNPSGIYTPRNQLERLAKEVKRRTKVVGFPGRRRWGSFCTWFYVISTMFLGRGSFGDLRKC